MQIKTDLATLKQTRWYELLIRFVIGGTITVVAGLLARKLGPAIGGLFLAFPAIFPASATLVEKHEAEKKREKGMHGEERGRDAAALDAAGAAMGSIGLMLFALVVWRLLRDHSSWLTQTLALVLWFVSSCTVWFVREHRHRVFGFKRHPQLSLRLK
jgi:hypothetical protein